MRTSMNPTQASDWSQLARPNLINEILYYTIVATQTALFAANAARTRCRNLETSIRDVEGRIESIGDPIARLEHPSSKKICIQILFALS